jgi:hypothetical protein
LAPSRWYHWGASPQFSSLDYPIHDRILSLQTFVLSDQLRDRLASVLRNRGNKLDPYTKANLEEASDRIPKAIKEWFIICFSDKNSIKSKCFFFHFH